MLRNRCKYDTKHERCERSLAKLLLRASWCASMRRIQHIVARHLCARASRVAHIPVPSGTQSGCLDPRPLVHQSHYINYPGPSGSIPLGSSLGEPRTRYETSQRLSAVRGLGPETCFPHPARSHGDVIDAFIPCNAINHVLNNVFGGGQFGAWSPHGG